MMAVRRRVLRFLAHTRFVPTPLYRLMVLAWGVSGVIALVGSPTDSIQSVAGPWFDIFMPALQVLACFTVLVGLYQVEGNTHHATKLNRSLFWELIGIIELETVLAWQVAAATLYTSRLPSSGPTWMAIIFGVWILFRVKDIVLAMRELGKPT